MPSPMDSGPRKLMMKPTFDRRPLSSCVRVIAAGMLAGIVACSASDGSVRVSGTVTVDGVPLEQGGVAFVDDTGASVALGFIKNGSYELERSVSQTGILPGTYSVVIRSWKEEPGQVVADGSFSKGISLIPEKYQDPKKSELKAEVGKSATTVDFELEGKKR